MRILKEANDITYRDIYNSVVKATENFTKDSGTFKYETNYEANLAEKILKATFGPMNDESMIRYMKKILKHFGFANYIQDRIPFLILFLFAEFPFLSAAISRIFDSAEP